MTLNNGNQVIVGPTDKRRVFFTNMNPFIFLISTVLRKTSKECGPQHAAQSVKPGFDI